MGKINLIIKREFLNRVRKKTFLAMCILGPLLIVSIFIVPSAIQKAAEQPWTIYVVEGKPISNLPQAGDFKYENNRYVNYDLKHIDQNYVDVIEAYKDSNRVCVLYFDDNILNKTGADNILVHLYSKEDPNPVVTAKIQDHIRELYQNILLNSQTKTRDGRLASDLLKANVSVQKNIYNADSLAEYEAGVSIGLSFLLYLFLLLFGSSVMKGVTEEKTSRIVEVLISSVKPFQLMLGKIIGIGLTAVLQFVLWIIFSVIFVQGFQSYYSNELFEDAVKQRTEMTGFDQTGVSDVLVTEAEVEQIENAEANQLLDKISHFNWVLISVCFFLFFIGGYLLYASFFAAIGAAMDADTDVQQWVFPITLPLILSLFIGISVNTNPHTDLAYWASLIPFSSPIVMMSRIPYLAADGVIDGNEIFQILSSIVLLYGMVAFTIFIAGRVYKTGILMYGQKVNLKTMLKWIKG